MTPRSRGSWWTAGLVLSGIVCITYPLTVFAIEDASGATLTGLAAMPVHVVAILAIQAVLLWAWYKGDPRFWRRPDRARAIFAAEFASDPDRPASEADIETLGAHAKDGARFSLGIQALFLATCAAAMSLWSYDFIVGIVGSIAVGVVASTAVRRWVDQ